MPTAAVKVIRPGRRLLAGLIAVATVVSAFGATAAAGAAARTGAATSPGGHRIEVMAPRAGAVIVARDAAAAPDLKLAARLQTTGPISRLAVRLNGHLLGGRGPHAGRRRVLLDRADGLVAGENLLWVQARFRGAGQPSVVPVRFFVGYRARGLLFVHARVGAGRGPAASASIGVPSIGVERVDVTLNGRRVQLPAVLESSARRPLDLAQLGIVHFGRNHLRVRLVMADGKLQVITRTLTLSGRRDVAVARLHGAATVGHTSVLDARGSLIASGGGTRDARWDLLRRPRSSHARLGVTTGKRTTLRPDVPGHYVIALRVGAGRHRGVDVLDAAATDPEPLVPLNTIAYDSGSPPVPGVQVGGTVYPGIYGPALQVLVLDRTTLGLVSNRHYLVNPQDVDDLGAYLQGLPSSDLVVVSYAGPEAGALPLPSNSLAPLDSALRTIGGNLAAQWAFHNSACWAGATNSCFTSDSTWQRGSLYAGSFTVIGIPGLAAGQAWRETAAQSRSSDGRIVGYLTLGTATDPGGANGYTVVPGPDPFVPVASCSSDGCDVTVGGQTFPSAPGVSGFHVVVLDRTTLQPILNRTVTTTADLLPLSPSSPARPSGTCSSRPIWTTSGWWCSRASATAT